jgi:hypothetical protein
VSALQLATFTVEHVVLQLARHARAIFRILRSRLEYLRDARTLSGLRPPVDVDILPELRTVVAA